MAIENLGLKISELQQAYTINDDALLVIAQNNENNVLYNYSVSPELVANQPVSRDPIEIKGSPFATVLKNMYGTYLPAYITPVQFIRNMASYEYWVKPEDIKTTYSLDTYVPAPEIDVYDENGLYIYNNSSLIAGSYITVGEISIPEQYYKQQLTIENLKYGYKINDTTMSYTSYIRNDVPDHYTGYSEATITFYGFLDMDGNDYNCSYIIKDGETLPEKNLYVGLNSCYIKAKITKSKSAYATIYGTSRDTEYDELLVMTNFGNTTKSYTDHDNFAIPIKWDSYSYIISDIAYYNMFNINGVQPIYKYNSNSIIDLSYKGAIHDNWDRELIKNINNYINIDASYGNMGFGLLLPQNYKVSYINDLNAGSMRITDAFEYISAYSGSNMYIPCSNGVAYAYFDSYVYNTDIALEKDNKYQVKLIYLP